MTTIWVPLVPNQTDHLKKRLSKHTPMYRFFWSIVVDGSANEVKCGRWDEMEYGISASLPPTESWLYRATRCLWIRLRTPLPTCSKATELTSTELASSLSLPTSSISSLFFSVSLAGIRWLWNCLGQRWATDSLSFLLKYSLFLLKYSLYSYISLSFYCHLS